MQLIRLALREDLGPKRVDATAKTLFRKPSPQRKARIFSKHRCEIVVCGVEVARRVFKEIGGRVSLQVQKHDGELLSPGEDLLVVTGPAASLLKGERVALNFLQRLCAIATLTRAYVTVVQGTKTRILDTRKTTPGMRHLEKFAVLCGGGVNHRMGLYDALMIKNNHVDMVGSMEEVLRRLPRLQQRSKPVIVEVRTLQELDTVMNFGQGKVTRILFDNFNLSALRAGIERCGDLFETEASGGINLKTVRAISETGVQFASVGRLTHSAGSVDLSMHWLP